MNPCNVVSVVVLAVILPAQVMADPARELSVSVVNVSQVARPAGPTTFGMVFARGDVPGTVAVRDLPSQVDVKRRWPDGSIKHAIITVVLPDMAAGVQQDIRFEPVAEPAGKLAAPAVAKDLGEVAVNVAIHNGPALSAKLSMAMAGQPERVWLAGEHVSEWHFKSLLHDAQGRADPDLVVRFQVRHYPRVRATRIACVVENANWLGGGNIPYDVTVTVNGKEAIARKQVGDWPGKDYIGHPHGTRWVRRFWLRGESADVHVRYDRAYWNRTGLLPPYDPAIRVPEPTLARHATRWSAGQRDILQNGLIHPHFGGTGGRADIGPLPLWASLYVVSQDPRAKAAMLDTADLSGSCPIHIRDEATDSYVSIDDHPRYSFNRAGSGVRVAPRDISQTPWVLPARAHIAPDAAHQPSLAYVPYLITGDYYYLEEMQFWANWNMAKQNFGYRQQARGLLTPDQVRGTAWALRNLVHAAALSPDNDPGKTYFEDKLAENLKHLNDFVAGRLDRKPTAIGTYTLGAGSAYTAGLRWPPQSRGKYADIAGWMHNFLAWSLAYVASHGYCEAAAPRDYLMTFSIGAFTNPDQIVPYAGTAYFLMVGQRDAQGRMQYYQTWKQVAEGTYGPVEGEPKPEPPTQVSYETYGGSYSYIARGVLLEALRVGRPGAAEALAWLDDKLPKRDDVLASDPTWAFERSR